MAVLDCKIFLVLLFLCIVKMCSALLNGTIVVEEIEVNGREIRLTYSDKYPFVVELLRNGLHHCGGALVTSNAVITAARCISPSKVLPDVKQYTLLAGNQIIKEDGDIFEQTRSVEKIVLAQEWPTNKAADFAILKPSSEFELTNWVNVISLDFEWTESYTYGRQFGWGYTEKLRYSSMLRYSDTYVQEGHMCFDPNVTIPGLVCLNEDSGYPCHGDFGGPIIVDLDGSYNDYALVGIISHNPGAAVPDILGKITCQDEKYTVGVNITHFRSDIDKILKN